MLSHISVTATQAVWVQDFSLAWKEAVNLFCPKFSSCVAVAKFHSHKEVLINQTPLAHHSDLRWVLQSLHSNNQWLGCG